MHRRSFLKMSAAAGFAAPLLARPAIAQDREILIAEPTRSVSYLPIYLAITEGYFKKAGLNAKMLTAEQNGAAINATLAGQAFSFLGGPERVAFARAQGGQLRSVVNCVDRGNVYFMAAKGTGPKAGEDIGAYLKGKRIAVSARGTSPHSVMRYVLMAKFQSRPGQGRAAHRGADIGAVCRDQSQTRRRRYRVRACHRAGHRPGPVGRAVLQRAEGAWSARLYSAERGQVRDRQGAAARH